MFGCLFTIAVFMGVYGAIAWPLRQLGFYPWSDYVGVLVALLTTGFIVRWAAPRLERGLFNVPLGYMGDPATDYYVEGQYGGEHFRIWLKTPPEESELFKVWLADKRDGNPTC